jgi:hypothetical protein
MELSEIRFGNYVMECQFSSRGRALEPFFRVDRQDYPYNNFLRPIPIDLEWCKRLGMDIEEKTRWATGGNFDWTAEAPGIMIRSYLGKITVFNCMAGAKTILEHIMYVHQIQNLYYGMWGFEIDEKNPTEFYKGHNEMFNYE